MRRKLSFLSLARRMYSGMRSGVPISRSMLSAASLAPPCAGPQRQAQPAAMQAKGLAPEEPARRTVEVEAFCSWSACRIKIRSIARASTALGLYSSHRKAHAQKVGRVVELVLGIDERLADRIFVGHCRHRRHLGDHADRSDHPLGWITDVRRVVIKCRECSDAAGHDGHR